jgi:hypothetical protein
LIGGVNDLAVPIADIRPERDYDHSCQRLRETGYGLRQPATGNRD